jgi:hypothetical protein
VRRKKEYYRRQEEARLLKIREEEEARKLEGLLSIIPVFALFLGLCDDLHIIQD